MKVKNGFLMYLFIFAGILVGAAIVMAAILMLRPGTEIFGLTYLNENKEYQYVSATVDSKFKEFNNYDRVVVSSVVNDNSGKFLSFGDFSIEFRAGNRDAVSSNFTVNHNIQGIAKIGEKSEYSATITEQTIQGEKVLDVTISQNTTWISLGHNLKITVNIPESLNVSNVIFEARTKGGTINFGADKQLDNAPSPISAKGFIGYTEKGGVCVNNISTASSVIDLKSVSGPVRLIGDKKATNISLESQTGKIEAEDLDSNTVKITTNNSYVETGHIKGDVNLDAYSGVIRLGNIGGSLQATEKVSISDIQTGDIAGDVGIPKGKSIIFNAPTVVGHTSINTVGGTIVIGGTEATNYGVGGRTDIETIKGNVKIKVSAYNTRKVEVKTVSGHITAVYESAEDKSYLETTSGSITISLLQTASVNLFCETHSTTVYDWSQTTLTNEVSYREIRGNNVYNGSVIYATSNTGKISVSRQTDLSF